MNQENDYLVYANQLKEQYNQMKAEYKERIRVLEERIRCIQIEEGLINELSPMEKKMLRNKRKETERAWGRKK